MLGKPGKRTQSVAQSSMYHIACNVYVGIKLLHCPGSIGHDQRHIILQLVIFMRIPVLPCRRCSRLHRRRRRCVLD